MLTSQLRWTEEHECALATADDAKGRRRPPRRGARSHPRDTRGDPLGGERLEQVIDDTELIGVERVLRVGGGEYECRRVRVAHERDPVAVAAGKLHVDEHDVGRDRSDRFARVSPRAPRETSENASVNTAISIAVVAIAIATPPRSITPA
jgi:hypothetical protein